MEYIDVDKLDRKKTYLWFDSFVNPTYGVTSRVDVTNVVRYAKENNKSFFIVFLYLITRSMNEVKEMRMRFVNDNPVIFDTINPAVTVMTKNEIFENVNLVDYSDFEKFYSESKKYIDLAKNETELTNVSYNESDKWDYYYITCLPWIRITSVTHPIPTDKSSLSVPRICWGKYVLENDKYLMELNITVSHTFVDGYHLSKVFNILENKISKM